MFKQRKNTVIWAAILIAVLLSTNIFAKNNRRNKQNPDNKQAKIKNTQPAQRQPQARAAKRANTAVKTRQRNRTERRTVAAKPAKRNRSAPARTITKTRVVKKNNANRTRVVKTKKTVARNNNKQIKVKNTKRTVQAAPARNIKRSVQKANKNSTPVKTITKTKTRRIAQTPTVAKSAPRKNKNRTVRAAPEKTVTRKRTVKKNRTVAIAPKRNAKTVKTNTIVKTAPKQRLKRSARKNSNAVARQQKLKNEQPTKRLKNKAVTKKNVTRSVVKNKRNKTVVKSTKTKTITPARASKRNRKTVVKTITKPNRNKVVKKTTVRLPKNPSRLRNKTITKKTTRLPGRSVTKKTIITPDNTITVTKTEPVVRAGAISKRRARRNRIGRTFAGTGRPRRSKRAVKTKTITKTTRSGIRTKHVSINKNDRIFTSRNVNYPYTRKRHRRHHGSHYSRSHHRRRKPKFSFHLSSNNFCNRYSSYYRYPHKRNYRNRHWRHRHSSYWYLGYNWYRPNCGTVVYYRYRPYRYGVSYIYPSYHRRYIFVSYGGYWPVSYRYHRYYWYGCHPRRWYGYSPDVYVVEKDTGDTYNTYNYYGNGYSTVQPTYSYDSSGNIIPDYDAFSEVRERLNSDNDGTPEAISPTDQYFEQTIKAFGEADYEKAELAIEQAIKLSPDDIVLPFVYAQVLFAQEKYWQASAILREAIESIPEDKLSVFFPRGLYKDDEVLTAQIDTLQVFAESEVYDSQLKLLLGYQLMGVEKFDSSKSYLKEASASELNETAAEKLLDILEQAKEDAAKEDIL